METCKAVQTFESVDEILRCDHSSETSLASIVFSANQRKPCKSCVPPRQSLAVLLNGTICFTEFEKRKFRICLEVLLWPLLGVKGFKAALSQPRVSVNF